MVWSMPMLHNSGSTFNTDLASKFFNPDQPGTNQLQNNKMASVGVDPSTGKDTVFYSFTDTAGLPAGASVFNLTNIDGFTLNAGVDYEMIIEGNFDASGTDPNATFDVVFKRVFIDGTDTITNSNEIARFGSVSTGLAFRRYVGINMDYNTAQNNFVWTAENVSFDSSQYAAPPVNGTWTAYVIQARREIDGTN